MNVIDQAQGNEWVAYNGDSAEVLPALPSKSVDLSIYSPPFVSLYTYSPSERDLGNCRDPKAFWRQFGFISPELLRVTKPGRITCVHVSQIATQLAKDGVIGLQDFRGDTIRHYQEQGWIYHGEVCIDKDPQAQAIRTHAKGLLFVQLERDASWMRPALADYILLFRAPGENKVKVEPDITREQWIEWARPVWYGIVESDTLNKNPARENADDRHICPLQLGTIERCIRLWSNPGETILSPFMGIGSEGHVALKLKRKFVGVELKPSYFRVATSNLQAAEYSANQPDLFSFSGVSVDPQPEQSLEERFPVPF